MGGSGELALREFRDQLLQRGRMAPAEFVVNQCFSNPRDERFRGLIEVAHWSCPLCQQNTSPVSFIGATSTFRT